MKNLFMLIGIAGALAMASCGGNNKEDKKEVGKGLSACDCLELSDTFMNKYNSTESNEEKVKIEEEYEPKMKACSQWNFKREEMKAACEEETKKQN